MNKLWAGRTNNATNKMADDFNSSFGVDKRMIEQDVNGSIAHATMLGECGIIPKADADLICAELEKILADIKSGAQSMDKDAEDVHMFVEAELTERLGAVGKKLHTARSRNDQVATDFKLWVMDAIGITVANLKKLLGAIYAVAEKNQDAIMPGYTHLQRAQPITFAHHVLAYAEMFKRDIGRLNDAAGRMSVCPLGSAALAGTTYPIDRALTAQMLGFSTYSANSMDGVSDRDFALEALSALSIVMMHLSRLAEEVILWTSWEFGFVELDDAFTTGSSIMPQKKNSDMAELVRGKTGRVYGSLMGLLTTMKGLPLAYNKDMQEDKECVFDAFDTVNACLEIFAPMLCTAKVKKDVMLAAAKKGFINATDAADYLTKKGVPFREAYKVVGQTVAACIAGGKTLDDLTLAEWQAAHSAFDQGIFDAIDLTECVNKRTSQGGTGAESVKAQLEALDEYLK